MEPFFAQAYYKPPPLMSTLNFRGRAKNFYFLARNRVQNRISISPVSAASARPTSNSTEPPVAERRRAAMDCRRPAAWSACRVALPTCPACGGGCARGGRGTPGRSDCDCAAFWDGGACASGFAGTERSEPRGLDVALPSREQGFEFEHQLRLFRGHVVLLAFVPGQVEKLLPVVVHDQFP